MNKDLNDIKIFATDFGLTANDDLSSLKKLIVDLRELERIKEFTECLNAFRDVPWHTPHVLQSKKLLNDLEILEKRLCNLIISHRV